MFSPLLHNVNSLHNLLYHINTSGYVLAPFTQPLFQFNGFFKNRLIYLACQFWLSTITVRIMQRF